MVRFTVLVSFVLTYVSGDLEPTCENHNDSTECRFNGVVGPPSCTGDECYTMCYFERVLISVTGNEECGYINIADCGLVSIKPGAFKNLSSGYLTLSEDNAYYDNLDLPLYNETNNISISQSGVFAGLPKLKSLNLAGQTVQLSSGLFKELTTLETLKLNRNSINHIPRGTFNGLSQLEELIISGNKITALTPHYFEGLSQLYVLWLYGNEINSISDGAFDGLPQLKWLDFSRNRISAINRTTFSCLPKVTNINLAQNKITTIAAGSFSNVTELRILQLDRNDIREIAHSTFEGLFSVLVMK
ncbi:insulin-like growth factor-binding protein complex acid labile subunit [Diprion similis]|uniref:insulin-like growth factor-binding protein complex acid labile subunit n=1 Tax=Diprion similis TaxID=362088 RepID=UPI001EF7FF37|nr:insulin-like growth factor-binding protein complex acid labile subunit [Diprion similis]